MTDFRLLSLGLTFFSMILILFSPARDLLANLLILVPTIVIVVIMSTKLIFARLNMETFPQKFAFNIIGLVSSVLTLIGLIFGKILASWHPFTFIPFGYYFYLSLTINFNLFYFGNKMIVYYRVLLAHQSTNK